MYKYKKVTLSFSDTAQVSLTDFKFSSIMERTIEENI